MYFCVLYSRTYKKELAFVQFGYMVGLCYTVNMLYDLGFVSSQK